jgi:hypothetical protein
MTLSLIPARLARALTESAARLSSAYMLVGSGQKQRGYGSGHDQHGYI